MGERWKKIIIIGVIGLLFWWRFLFLLTPIEEEVTGGGLVEAKVGNVVQEADGKITFSLSTCKKEVKIGKISVLFYPYPRWPMVRIKHEDKEFPILCYPYNGFLYTFIPFIFLEIFGKNIYSLKLLLLVLFIIFLWLYMGVNILEERTLGEKVLLAFFLITFPLFSIGFINFIFPLSLFFIFIILLFNRIMKILDKETITSSDILILSRLRCLEK